MTEVMSAITDAGTAITGYVGAAVAAGIGIGIVVYGAKRAWAAFKAIG